METGGETVSQRFGARENASGHRQLADHVGAGELAHEGNSAHVGDDAPFDFHDREARVRRDIADVGAKGDLKAAAQCDPMDRRNDRNGKRAPDISRLLESVGDPMRTFREIAQGRRALRHK